MQTSCWLSRAPPGKRSVKICGVQRIAVVAVLWTVSLLLLYYRAAYLTFLLAILIGRLMLLRDPAAVLSLGCKLWLVDLISTVGFHATWPACCMCAMTRWYAAAVCHTTGVSKCRQHNSGCTCGVEDAQPEDSAVFCSRRVQSCMVSWLLHCFICAIMICTLMTCKCMKHCPTAMGTTNSQVVKPASHHMSDSTIADNAFQH